MAAPTMFLQLTVGHKPVAGDATMPGYESQIAIDSCSWSCSAEHRAVGRRWRTTFTHGQLRLSKSFDRSSTALYGHLKGREKVDSAHLTVVDPTLLHGQSLKLLELRLLDCCIESISARAGDAGSVMQVTEELMLSFGSGLLRYHPGNPEAAGRLAPTEYRIPAARSRD